MTPAQRHLPWMRGQTSPHLPVKDVCPTPHPTHIRVPGRVRLELSPAQMQMLSHVKDAWNVNCTFTETIPDDEIRQVGETKTAKQLQKDTEDITT